MSQPEISRRCLSCGASVRAGARFCPQCGAAVKDGAHESPGGNQTAADAWPASAPEAPSRREVKSAFETWREEARQTTPQATAATARHEVVDEGVGGPNVAAAAEEGRGAGVVAEGARLRRAGAVVKENIMPRVERMRDEALVVLEETPDDAGLRFVAVAVVVFLLFLIALFLSTVLK